MQLISPPRTRRGLLARLREHNREDAGFTLVELLVSIVIMGVITVPLAAALIMFFQRSNETTNRLSVNHDVQISSSYFAQDVASIGRHDWTAVPFPLAQSVQLNVAWNAGIGASNLGKCGTSGTAAVRLLWDDPSAGSSSLVSVSYVVKTVNGESQLHRVKCTGTSSTPVSDTVLAHNVTSVDTVTCSTTCESATLPPQTVTLVLHLKAPNSTDPDLKVTLTGQRRQTNVTSA
jgi:prepilin-type N-terminal cleavage/methylation domain-containing protein